MTLLTAVFAAIITTVIWYFKDGRNHMKTGSLALMYWGASIMWFVDAVFGFAEKKTEYFIPSPAEMLNGFFLGMSVIALGLLIWLIMFLAVDSKGVIRQALHKTKKHL